MSIGDNRPSHLSSLFIEPVLGIALIAPERSETHPTDSESGNIYSALT